MKPSYQAVIQYILRIALGVTFVYSSYHKIQDPAAFANIIYGYAIFPDVSINILAITIPFIELTSGFCLLFKVVPRAAILIINALLTAFIIVVGFNLLRGHEFDCGCFSNAISKDPKLANIITFIRDILLLAAGVYYLKNEKQ